MNRMNGYVVSDNSGFNGAPAESHYAIPSERPAGTRETGIAAPDVETGIEEVGTLLAMFFVNILSH